MRNRTFSPFWTSRGGGFNALPIAIRSLIAINALVFVFQFIGGEALNNWLVDHFAFDPAFPTVLTQPWRLVTYSFLHGGFMHILFNMLWLWWMGKTVEQTIGPRAFLVIYFGAAIAGALLDAAIAYIFGATLVIGASGAVTGILVAFAVLHPRAPIMLFLLPPIPAKYFVIGWVALDVLFVGSNDGVARLVHLGGALGGYMLIKAHLEGKDLTLIPRYIEYLFNSGKKKTKTKTKTSKTRNKNMHIVKDVEIVEEVEQSELDAILDKISKYGYSKLTDEEKRKLFDISKKE